MPRPGFPKSLREFQSQFATEEACRHYLAACRWPDGFACPKCGNRSAYEMANFKRWECAGFVDEPIAENPASAKRSAKLAYDTLPTWKLQDANAHFSRVVRQALELGPQRVTLHGKNAVVILAAEDYRRLAPAAAQPSLHALLSRSPLQDLDFELGGVCSPVRDVEW